MSRVGLWATLLLVWIASIAGVVAIYELGGHPPAYSPREIIEAIRTEKVKIGTNIDEIPTAKAINHQRWKNDAGIETSIEIYQDEVHTLLLESQEQRLTRIILWRTKHGEAQLLRTAEGTSTEREAETRR